MTLANSARDFLDTNFPQRGYGCCPWHQGETKEDVTHFTNCQYSHLFRLRPDKEK